MRTQHRGKESCSDVAVDDAHVRTSVSVRVCDPLDADSSTLRTGWRNLHTNNARASAGTDEGFSDEQVQYGSIQVDGQRGSRHIGERIADTATDR